jgi:acetyl esterase/lipase
VCFVLFCFLFSHTCLNIGTEILMAENLLLAQKAQAAGAPVTCQVYEGMWHDFEEFSQVGVETVSFFTAFVCLCRL